MDKIYLRENNNGTRLSPELSEEFGYLVEAGRESGAVVVLPQIDLVHP